MGSANLEMGIIFLMQISIGFLGNSILLCLYNFTLFTKHKMRPTDLILNQLVLANSMVLFSRGIPQIMESFGQKYFLDNTGCKLVFYLHRVGRGVSLTTTCLLSVFQATKLCPNCSQRLEKQMRSSKCIGFCCFLLWILHLLLNIIVPLNMTQSLHSKNISVMRLNFGYCSSYIQDKFIKSLHAVMFSSFDAIILGLMVWSSGSTVLVLHRHKQRTQHIRSHSLSKLSHETRATNTILILVSSFILFDSLSSIFTFVFCFVDLGQWLVLSSVLVSSCFPTFSSFVLISTDSRISQFCPSARKTFFLKCLCT